MEMFPSWSEEDADAPSTGSTIKSIRVGKTLSGNKNTQTDHSNVE
jgi:hypothetical protein